MKIKLYIYFVLSSLLIFSCTPDEELQTSFGSFEVLENNSASMTGSITAQSSSDLESLLEAFPNTNSITINNLDGATSAEAAFNAARIVRANNINIHIAANSTITNEAVDFFLGGVKRTKGENVKIGQSAWRNEQGQEATDFEFGDAAHLPWINFYVEMGYQYQLATDYYNFYIYAATSDEIYYLTEDQLNTFGIIN